MKALMAILLLTIVWLATLAMFAHYGQCTTLSEHGLKIGNVNLYGCQ